jgi:hypothetical protein
MSDRCEACGKPWVKHMGIMGICAQLSTEKIKVRGLEEECKDLMLDLQIVTEQRDAALWIIDEYKKQKVDTIS